MEQVAEQGPQPPPVFSKDMRAAMMAGEKLYARQIVTAENTLVAPGTFDGVRWETGRVKRDQSGNAFLRAQCWTAGNALRVVTITPSIQEGQIWEHYVPRLRSTMRAVVTSVSISRVNDLTDRQALEEGVEHLPVKMRKQGTPRDWFALHWDQLHGTGSWAHNPWVWILGLDTQLRPGR